VISVASPIIEEFAQEPIRPITGPVHETADGEFTASFAALYHVVCAYGKDDGGPVNKSTLNQLLRHVRDHHRVRS
jgi:hypothetical protein